MTSRDRQIGPLEVRESSRIMAGLEDNVVSGGGLHTLTPAQQATPRTHTCPNDAFLPSRTKYTEEGLSYGIDLL